MLVMPQFLGTMQENIRFHVEKGEGNLLAYGRIFHYKPVTAYKGDRLRTYGQIPETEDQTRVVGGLNRDGACDWTILFPP